MKKEKKRQIIQQLEIIDCGSEGQSIAKLDNMVVFVKGAVPGDVVDVEVTRKKANYREGNAIHFHKFSADRIAPACNHFGTCGGCKWQYLNYNKQTHYKQKQVANALQRIGGFTDIKVSDIITSDQKYEYRNKLEFTFSNKKWLTHEQIQSGDEFNRNALGFHIPGMFDKVLDIEKCYLQDNLSNEIRNELKDFALKNNYSFYDIRAQVGFLRNVIIRNTTTGEWMIVMVFGENDEAKIYATLKHLANKFSEITSLLYVVNTKKNDTIGDLDVHTYKGNPYMTEQMENLKFRIGPKSFYQTNPQQAYQLYKTARELAALTGNETVYDLYTGTGTIANFVAQRTKKVVGIEYVADAINDAKINSQINNINNTLFFSGDMKDILTAEFILANEKPDIIITDPPRAGMHESVTERILQATPAKIIYVSCNPATQARDMVLMREQYEIKKVQPVDMFPHTHHVENVVLLEKK
jgi:23S rRNA (uracil1939-C5)-methyltransferase